MDTSVAITSIGIKRLLRRFSPETAIAEYVWNGFDAKADQVSITYTTSALGNITEMSVSDNGEGILPQDLDNKFRPFFQSNRLVEIEAPRNHSIPRGRQGVGRLTFFTFANLATWKTCARDGNGMVQQSIVVNGNTLKDFSNTVDLQESTAPSGTTVTFTMIDDLSEDTFTKEVLPYLRAEFAWYLELMKPRHVSLRINGVPLDYAAIVRESEEFERTLPTTSNGFSFRFKAWTCKLNREYSKYYFINSIGKEVWKCNTTLNNKGDNFYHSLYVQSAFFDTLFWTQQESDDEHDELFLSQKHPAFKELMAVMSRYLHDKRAPYLEELTQRLIVTYQAEHVFPTFNTSAVGQFEKQMLETTVRELYKVEPQIFSNLNTQQKKAFIELLNAMLEMGADDRLLDIVAAIAKLTPEERSEFAAVLHFSSMSAITKTIGMIKDRVLTISNLKQLVFKTFLEANERDHLQKLLEKHYWIFGEQYTLVTAEEPDFVEALRRFLYILRGDSKKVSLDDADKNKEMDIFCVRRDIHRDTVESIVVELKHPDVLLSSKELEQVKKYMRTILNEDRFNATNHFWKFYLIGNDFSKDGAIQGELETNKNHGETSLAFKAGNYKIYVKRWSEVFSEFECRYKFILEKLELDKAKLLEVSGLQSADAIVIAARQNLAAETATYEKPRDPIGEPT
jgi:hypothetical protein